jgi:chromate transport protein ChrA
LRFQIPLLRGYTVDPGWVSNRDFLLGFAILQAFPGPNFAFATYLGLLSLPSNPVLGAVLGYIGIFSPGILLKLALLPLYNKWRRYQVAKSVLRGLNAAAAGLVYVAVWQLFLGELTGGL